jgi:hypothetical protein
MRSSPFEDEDRSITRAFPEGPPARASVSKGGMKRSPMGILVAEESWRHWVKDILPQRESVNAWCLSYHSLVVSRERERRTLRKLERWDVIWL